MSLGDLDVKSNLENYQILFRTDTFRPGDSVPFWFWYVCTGLCGARSEMFGRKTAVYQVQTPSFGWHRGHLRTVDGALILDGVCQALGIECLSDNSEFIVPWAQSEGTAEVQMLTALLPWRAFQCWRWIQRYQCTDPVLVMMQLARRANKSSSTSGTPFRYYDSWMWETYEEGVSGFLVWFVATAAGLPVPKVSYHLHVMTYAGRVVCESLNAAFTKDSLLEACRIAWKWCEYGKYRDVHKIRDRILATLVLKDDVPGVIPLRWNTYRNPNDLYNQHPNDSTIVQRG